jgi:alanine racemase
MASTPGCVVEGTSSSAANAVPIVGAVSMDMITVDVTDIGEVQPGDEVVLLGPAGQGELAADRRT